MVAALTAVGRGFHVFPIPPGEKAATYRWSTVATNDAARVVQWWTATPLANIGVACRQSGLFVVDCDVAKENFNLEKTNYRHLHDRYGRLRIDGIDVLAEYCKEHKGDFDELCSTYSVGTTRGGIHFYFRWTSPRPASQASIVKGVLDVRTNGGPSGGGYVLAAGSRTETGPYWTLADRPVLHVPSWLAELVEEKPYVPRQRLSDTDRYMMSSGGFSGLENAVRQAHEGNRNNALYWAARAMCADGAEEETAYEYLVDAAREAGLNERDIRASIRSGYRAQGFKEGIR